MPGGLNPPPDVIASWPKPSLHPEVVGWGTAIGLIILYVIALVVVAGRLYARIYVQKNAGIDDALITLSLVRENITICS
jgi:hypothetical protein